MDLLELRLQRAAFAIGVLTQYVEAYRSVMRTVKEQNLEGSFMKTINRLAAIMKEKGYTAYEAGLATLLELDTEAGKRWCMAAMAYMALNEVKEPIKSFAVPVEME